MAKQKFLVTSALPYVNGVKHIGNLLGSLLPADVYARYLRSKGEDVVFVCGTDEHGTPCELAALEEKLPVEKYAEKYYKIQKKVYAGWGLSFDYFGRTSSKENYETTQELFLAAHKRGFIKEKTLKLPYCIDCKRFLPDRYLTGVCPHCKYPNAKGDQCEKCGRVLDPIELLNPVCAVCKKTKIEFRESRHLFLDLPALSNDLHKWIALQKQWPDNARNFALGWFKDGLKERCITRDLEWGVKVPLKGFEDKVFYVWFDAPIGYISFTKEFFKTQDRAEEWREYWQSKDARIIHFLGKDNIAFHTVIWPGMLLASQYAQMPWQVKSLEFLNYEGQKFSTSRKWGIFTDEALDWFPADYWRYYLLSILPESSDADFIWDDFKKSVNNDLADVFGNLVHRCLVFARNNFGGKIPHGTQFSAEDEEFRKKIAERVAATGAAFDSFKLQEALREAIALAHDSNKYFNSKEPWKRVKTNQQDAANTIFLTANAIHSLSIILEPFIPFSCAKTRKFLNAKSVPWAKAGRQNIASNHVFSEKFEPLFRKLEDDEIDEKAELISKRSQASQ
ncbi:MAG: methionine--tRNA ligase [Candidatus Micrarchaeota archaeon]